MNAHSLDSVMFTSLSPAWLVAVPIAIAIGLLLALMSLVTRARVRRYFATAPHARTAVHERVLPSLLGAACLAAALACTAVALARPAGNPKPVKVERSGRDVVFVIDVSRSMLAEDLRPSRLERAKLGVSDVLDVIQGDRVAIVAFAGAAVVKCPLTTDYSFARMALEDLSPESVNVGGTAIGTAINSAVALLFADTPTDATPVKRSRTVFIMTDGEDHESDPLERAKAAGARGVRIVALGLGSDLSGAPVPAPRENSRSAPTSSGFVSFNGRTVQSRMDPDALKRIADATPGGVFLNVGVGNVELDRLYQRLMAGEVRERQDDDATVRYSEYFQLPLAAALMFLALKGLIHAART